MRRTKRNNKNLEEILKRPYSVLITPDPKGGFVAEVPDLPGCITEGDDLDEVFRMIEDAKRIWIETALEKGKEIPEPREERKFSGRFVVRIPKTLHRRLAEMAEKEGVSLNTVVVQVLSEGIAHKETLSLIDAKLSALTQRGLMQINLQRSSRYQSFMLRELKSSKKPMRV